MNYKLETSETATLKLLQEKANESTQMVQAYAVLLSKKYELPFTSKFALSPDFTLIVELPEQPQPSSESPAALEESPAPRRRKAKEAPATEVPVTA